MLFFNSKNRITIDKFLQINNKICIYRGVGGLGDILAMRMIFEDLKAEHPDLHITWAVPFKYFPVAKDHPHVDEVIHLDSFCREDFAEFFDVTTCCGKYESVHKMKNPKNRSDIWAEYFGITLKNHNMYIPNYEKHFDKVIERLRQIGWDGKKKLVPFAPRSAISLKNMTYEQCAAVKEMTKDFFVFGLHNAPVIDLAELKIPGIYNFSIDEAMAAVQMCFALISTDTGFMHAAGGWGKPVLATFSIVDGETYCKYYPLTQVVQIHMKDFDNWCGPCYNYPQCHYKTVGPQKPCQTEINAKMLQENWDKLLNRL